METDFVERILEFRRRTAEIREIQQDNLLSSMYDLDNALGRMISFTNLNTENFPLDSYEVSTSSEVEPLSDYGMQVIALREEDRASRVYANIQTRDLEEQMTLTLYSSKVMSKYRWLLETQSRSSDGSVTDHKTRYETAGDALTALKTRLLHVACDIASNGHYEFSGALPDGDVDAAIAIHKHMDNAAEQGLAAQKLAQTQRQERARVSAHIVGLFTSNLQDLRFLNELGFAIEAEGNRSLISSRTSGGINIDINHGEGYRSSILVEAIDTDPSVISFTVSDNEGRKELRSHVSADDIMMIVSEIKSVVMAEIEDAEAAWLPAVEQHYEESLSRSMAM